MYYIYQHLDLLGNPFYIGKGKKDVFHSQGYSRAYSKAGRTKEWREIANKGLTVNIIKEFDNEEECLSEELDRIIECKNCVNKMNKRSSIKYEIYKLNEYIAILKIYSHKEMTYIISPDGKIFNIQGKEVKGSCNGKGYIAIKIKLRKRDGYNNFKIFYVHRLIAEAFIPNPENKKVVNHKDRNRANNNIENLEWCSQEENVQHSLKLGSYDFIDKIKPVLKLNTDGSIIEKYSSCSIAANLLNCTVELIHQAANKNNKLCLSAKGFIWVYEEDNNDNNEKLKKILEFYKFGVEKGIPKIIKSNILEKYKEIRPLFKTKNKTVVELSKNFNFCKRTIYSIINNEELYRL